MNNKVIRFLITIILAASMLIMASACTSKQEEPTKAAVPYKAETIATEKVEETAPETTEATTTAETTKAEETIAEEEEEEDDGRGSNSGGTAGNGDADDPGTDNTDLGADEEVKIEPPTGTAEDLATEVLNRGINGEEREAYLGERYDEVQAVIDARYSSYEPYTYVYTDVYDGSEEVWVYQPDTGVYYGDGALNAEDGVNYYGGVLETYYDLDMSWCIGVMRDMGYDEANYPYWVRNDGVKMLGDYVMCAADFDYEPRGTITSTSLGTAIVVDTGLGGWGWHDICVSGW